MGGEFSSEQKRYLEGLVSGIQAGRAARGLVPLGAGGDRACGSRPVPTPSHVKAQDRTKASGKKLVDQENWKREEHPFDAYPRLKAQAAQGRVSEAAR